MLSSPCATRDGAHWGRGAHPVLTFLRCCDPPPSAAGLEIPRGPNGAGDRAQAADGAECGPDPGAQAGRAAGAHSARRGAGPLFPSAADTTGGLRPQDTKPSHGHLRDPEQLVLSVSLGSCLWVVIPGVWEACWKFGPRVLLLRLAVGGGVLSVTISLVLSRVL